MSSLFIQVDRSQANYEQWFTYTIDASFNSMTQSIGLVELVCFLPDSVEYDVHPPVSPIASISYSPATVDGLSGTNITFTLIPIADSGLSLSFKLMARFNLPTTNGSTVVMQATLNQSNQTPQVYLAPSVTLQAVANLVIDQMLILPATSSVVSGSLFYYDIILQNLGAKGATCTDISLTELLPSGVTLDLSYPIYGKDISNNRFADSSADQTISTTSTDSFTFFASSYHGTKYRIRFRGQVSESFVPGDECLLIATLNYTSSSQIGPITNTSVLHVEEPSLSGSIGIYGPNHTRSNALINYQASFFNTGNVTLYNPEFHMTLTPNVSVTAFSTGSMWIEATEELLDLPYTLSFATNGSTVIPPLTLNFNQSQSLDVSGLQLAPGEKVITIFYNFSELPLGASLKEPILINGVVATTTSTSTRIYSASTLLWDTLVSGQQDEYNNNFSTAIDNISELYMTATEISPNRAVRPTDTITYRANISCRYSPLYEPIIPIVLSDHLEYDNYIDYSFTDYFGNSIVNIPKPVPLVIPNYGGGSSTVVLIQFIGADSYLFNQLATIRITLRFKVKIGATGTIRQNILLATNNSDFVVHQTMDTQQVVQPDGSVLLVLASNAIINLIELFTSIQADFKVKGALDTDYTQYPSIGHSYPGGSIDYQIEILNNGNVDILSIEVINIIPHPNDTGVILTSQSRGSEFTAYQITNAQASLDPIIPDEPVPTLSVQYSTSFNPIRYGANFVSPGVLETIGDPSSTWRSIPPADNTQIASYKVDSINTLIKPNQTLKIHAISLVPVGTPIGLQAWNSFAAKVTYVNASNQTIVMLPVEPEMVGVIVDGLDPNKAMISGFVWDDEDKDGIYVSGDPGVNDTVIMLYDEQGHYISTTITAPTAQGTNGYYIFNNIPHGKYYLRFVPDTHLYNLTKQVLSNPNGSMASPQTGFTPLIDMSTLSERTVIAGVFQIRRLDNILAVNKSANKTLRSVLYNQMLLDMKLNDVKELINYK